MDKSPQNEMANSASEYHKDCRFRQCMPHSFYIYIPGVTKRWNQSNICKIELGSKSFFLFSFSTICRCENGQPFSFLPTAIDGGQLQNFKWKDAICCMSLERSLKKKFLKKDFGMR